MARPKESPLWWPMFALPNVHATFPIEVDGFAMVPPDDFRIQAITRQQRRFGSFMKKFKTEFGDLAGITWNLTACKEKKYTVFGEKPGTLHSLPVWLFGEINRLRNDTLHGNPLPPGRLIVAPGKQAISMYAAPLYRMMLAAYLDLKLAPRKPTTGLFSQHLDTTRRHARW